ncbi:hypothetical protein [Streptomyces scopuliridis]|uniref:Uncharacterized protein n=1 Tax=Streptomyces scopuliridis TaxID=452529 RepID=A0ACD4ZNP1_9ACTN|nr:hypothetical protein [Streptomyces scopuliridis]WSC00098.1 hypothetical protein OG835_25940 [Streptomyces scopuliridis]
MKPSEVPQLLAEIALADPRVRRTNEIEQAAQTRMWAGILADVPYDYAVRAVQTHYAKSTWPILPADIATQWAATVRDRMRRDIDPTPIGVDPDDAEAYRHALAAHRRAVATGQQPVVEHQALAAGPEAAEVEARMAKLGDYLTTEARDALAAYRPAAAARTSAIRAGHPDALSVDCPVESCRAYVGRPCTRPGRGGARHTLTAGAHPSRTEAATTAMKPTPVVPAPAGAWPTKNGTAA